MVHLGWIFFQTTDSFFFFGQFGGKFLGEFFIRPNPRRCPSSPVADAQRICWMSPVGRSPSRHCDPVGHFFLVSKTGNNNMTTFLQVNRDGGSSNHCYLNTRSRWEQSTCSFQRLAFGMIQIWVMFFRERKSVLPSMGGFVAPSCWFGILVSGTWNSWACFHLGCHLNRKPLGYSKHL